MSGDYQTLIIESHTHVSVPPFPYIGDYSPETTPIKRSSALQVVLDRAHGWLHHLEMNKINLIA